MKRVSVGLPMEQMTVIRRAVSVDEVLDTVRLRGLPLIVAICAAGVLILDGFDIQAIGFAAPALVADLGVERSALAPALAASLLGMAFGAAGIGAIGDRWGRRPALLLSTVLFGSATLLAATATSVEALAAWRFVTGIGLGGALPTATTLMAEFSPQRWRSEAIGAAIVGIPVGGILGAMLAAEIVPAYGWRALFLIGGLLPMLAAATMYFILPESPRFLATRPDQSHVLAALLNRIEREDRYSGRDAFVLGAGGSAKRAVGIRALFRPQLRWDTVVTALVFLTSLFAVYAFFNWAPLVLTSIGFELATAVRGMLVFNVAGVIGALANARLISRFGSRGPLAMFTLTAVFALAGLSWASLGKGTDVHPVAGVAGLLTGIAIAGLALGAVQGGMYAVAAHVFPTGCRTSGVGWALGAGRLGGILSSFAGGMLLAQAGPAGFFAGVGGVLLLTLATVLLVRRHIGVSLHRSTAPCGLLVLLAALLATSDTDAQPAGDSTMLVHAGRLLDRPGEPPRGASTVVIRHHRIEAVRDGFVSAAEYPGAAVIDLRERFVLPGLIDCHVHLTTDKGGEARLLESLTNSDAYFAYSAALNARKTLEAGFTTVRNVDDYAGGVVLALRDAVAAGKLPGPRILDAGRAISTTAGHVDTTLGLNPDIASHLPEENLCDGPEACRRAVRLQVRRGVDVIKMMITGGVISRIGAGVGRQMFDDEARAIIDTAHLYGKKVAIHAHGADGIHLALKLGADSIEHGTLLDKQGVKLFLETGAYYVPTLSPVNDDLERLEDPNAYPPAVREKIERMISLSGKALELAYPRGVKIAFGTDAGVARHGRNADEFELMVKHGMPAAEAIKAATVNAADLLGISSEAGSIEPGKRADLIAVSGDPLADVTVLKNVSFVLRHGKVYKQ